MKNGSEFRELVNQTEAIFEDFLLGRLTIRRIYYPRSTYYYKLRKFEEQGLIKHKDRKKYPNTIFLTDKGRELIKKPKIAVKRTDGLSTIVLFDIPEEKRKARNIWRRYLLRNGYIQIQKSAFLGPVKFSTELHELAKELKIIPDLKIISGRLDLI